MAACHENQKPVDMTGHTTKKDSSRYEVGKVMEMPLSSYVKLPGQLKPYDEVFIYAKVNGFVKNVLADRGTVVRKGQVLIQLEAPEMESQMQAAISKYLQAQENAVASKEKYKRLKEAALEEGAVAPLDLDMAASRMKADEAIVMSEKSNVAAMKNIINYLTITAPFDGVIVQRNISAGGLVGPGGKSNELPMMVLQHLQKLRLEVYIPEAYVDKVDLKHQVSFTFNSMPGKENRANISRTANALSSMRSEAIEIDVNNSSQELKPGMYAEVKVPLLSGAKSLLVPSHAIVRSTERQYIIKVVDGKAHFADIKEGLKANEQTEIFGDVSKDDEIVLHATDEITEGTVIR
ncbi:efflux RND transporter periplasmic adaptor subunit [Filimonas effusa]|uniref:Efflux RND transporter periplasmic adaptor subunit n=2 Tax=Filimonas effusa TaxID=2508721 RepID=A0A4Q1D7F2_9BACT|nr:efflux RND transporter periplasmic adaptor subunit [Filimonas effusa]